MEKIHPAIYARLFAAGVLAGALIHGLITQTITVVVIAVWTAVLFFGVNKKYPAAALLLGFALAFSIFDARLSAAAQVNLFFDSQVEISGEVVYKNDHYRGVRLFVANPRLAAENSEKISGSIVLDLPAHIDLPIGERAAFACRLESVAAAGIKKEIIVRERLAGYCREASNFRKIGSARLSVAKFLADWAVGRISAALPFPESELAGGLIFGSSAGKLPKEVLNNFRVTGTSHIVAASGYNVSITAGFCVALFLLLGFYKRGAELLAIGCVFLYAAMAGFEPPVVRASIMAIAGIVAGCFGRGTRPLHSLLLAIAAMLVFEPELLLFDIGFELSAVATAGLIVLTPKFDAFFPKRWRRNFLIQLFNQNTAAILAALPLTLWRFESFSLIAPLANMLIVPLVPAAMAMGAVSIALADAGALTAGLSWIASLPLTYILNVAEFLGALPHSRELVSNFPWWGMVIGYLLLFVMFRDRPRTVVLNQKLESFEGWVLEPG
jgi:competence protein ComEC